VRRTLLVAVSLVVLGVACGKAAPSTVGTGDAGINGMVLLGPTCPVETAESPCPDKPIAAKVTVSTLDGRTVATVQSGSDGRFRVALSPGTYTLMATGLKNIRSSKPTTVTVPVAAFVDAIVAVDSGIR
jgi:hypothetical protein